MKRFVFFIICIILLLAFVGCNSNHTDITLTSGNYYIVGDYKDGMTPYINLNFDDNSFGMGADSFTLYEESGSFKISKGKIIATSYNSTFIFKIKDDKTLILIDNGNSERLQLEENTEFE